MVAYAAVCEALGPQTCIVGEVQRSVTNEFFILFWKQPVFLYISRLISHDTITIELIIVDR